MHKYKYTLQPYGGPASRYRCPACGRPRVFSRYIDTDTKQQVADNVGRCSREIKCAYHYTPKSFFADKGETAVVGAGLAPVRVRATQVARALTIPQACGIQQSSADTTLSFLPVQELKQSLDAYQRNAFVSFLAKAVGKEQAEQAIDRYCIGTSTHWPGACIF